MHNIWFTSDQHFGHKNILQFEPYHRPFATIEEMNETLIENYNNLVSDNDIVWHLGDFCFGKENLAIAGRLKGRKRLVLGNHDNYTSESYLQYFEKLYGCTFTHQFVLSHMPVHMRRSHRLFANIHGHLHSKVVKDEAGEPDDRYICVSVEQNNLKPFHYDEIFAKVKDLDFTKYTY